MGLFLFLVFGLVIGLLARALLPGNQKMGLVMTTVLGVAGSFVGGFLGSVLMREPVTGLHTAGAIGSLLGAMLLLFVMTSMSRRR